MKTSRLVSGIWYLFPFVLILAVWEVITIFSLFPPDILPPPTTTFVSFISLITQGTLVSSLIATVERVVVSLVIAIPLGIVVGLLMGWKGWIFRLLILAVTIVFAIPKLAFYGILLFFFGISDTSIVLIASLSAFFGVLFPAIASARSVDSTLMRVAKDYDARDMQIFSKVLFPNAVSGIASGVKLAVSLAYIEVVTTEMFRAAPGGLGLGWLIQLNAIYDQPGDVLAVLLVVLAFGGTVVFVADYLEGRLSTWRR